MPLQCNLLHGALARMTFRNDNPAVVLCADLRLVPGLVVSVCVYERSSAPK